MASTREDEPLTTKTWAGPGPLTIAGWVVVAFVVGFAGSGAVGLRGSGAASEAAAGARLDDVKPGNAEVTVHDSTKCHYVASNQCGGQPYKFKPGSKATIEFDVSVTGCGTADWISVYLYEDKNWAITAEADFLESMGWLSWTADNPVYTQWAGTDPGKTWGVEMKAFSGHVSAEFVSDESASPLATITACPKNGRGEDLECQTTSHQFKGKDGSDVSGGLITVVDVWTKYGDPLEGCQVLVSNYRFNDKSCDFTHCHHKIPKNNGCDEFRSSCTARCVQTGDARYKSADGKWNSEKCCHGGDGYYDEAMSKKNGVATFWC